MQTTAIRTVANSLPENEVILLTLLISKKYIPYTDLQKNALATYKKRCANAFFYEFLFLVYTNFTKTSPSNSEVSTLSSLNNQPKPR